MTYLSYYREVSERLSRALARSCSGQLRPPAAHRCRDPVGVQAEMVTPERLRAVVHLLVGDAEHLDVDARAALGEELDERRPESAGDHVLLHGDEARNACRERQEAILVQRLREARVHDRRLD